MKLSPALSSLLFLAALQVSAQNENRVQRDFRVEGESLKACGKFNFGSLIDCGQTLAPEPTPPFHRSECSSMNRPLPV
jgi:hypothetical protein